MLGIYTGGPLHDNALEASKPYELQLGYRSICAAHTLVNRDGAEWGDSRRP